MATEDSAEDQIVDLAFLGDLHSADFVLRFADGYQVVRIISHKPDTTHDNSGNLVVTVAFSPPLHAGYPGELF